MSVDGPYTLHYSWGCSASYGQSPITFNSDGTFGGEFTGQWVQQDGTLLWSYDGGPAKYGGTIDGAVGSGASSTFTGLNGCWYLTREGTVGIAAHSAEDAVRHQQAQDAAGNGH